MSDTTKPLTHFELESCIATLCDVIKRMEYAMQSSNINDREYYLEEAKKRRKQVEKKILRGKG